MSSESPEDEEQGERGVLSPDELEITDSERVAELDDGRFVISPKDGPPVVDYDNDESEFEFKGTSSSVELTAEDVYSWLAQRASNANAVYGFDVTGKFGDRVLHQELYSNDVTATFENLIVWFAQHAGEDTSVEEVLGILLMEANVPIKYPAPTLHALIEDAGLTPNDSIQELLDAVVESGEFRFPPE